MLTNTSSRRKRAYLQAMGVTLWEERLSEKHLSEKKIIQPVTAPQSDGNPDQQGWETLQNEVLNCYQCSLAKLRRHVVFGAGDRRARWMLVGEAPGAQEDKEGLPFVGRAGHLLNAILMAMGLSRQEVYIANVLKCRPPGNRDPLGEECRLCLPFLHQQLRLLQPAIILAMGRFAAQALLKTTDPISELRGRQHIFAETGTPLLVTYHPAYLLRSPLQKRKVWSDLQLALRIEARLE